MSRQTGDTGKKLEQGIVVSMSYDYANAGPNELLLHYKTFVGKTHLPSLHGRFIFPHFSFKTKLRLYDVGNMVLLRGIATTTL